MKHISTNDDIEKTLQSLDGISKAEMPPFFYTRLQAQLDKRKEAGSFWRIITKPAVSLVTLSLLLVVNVVAVRAYLKSTVQTTITQNSGIERFAEAYDLSASSSIDNDKTDNE